MSGNRELQRRGAVFRLFPLGRAALVTGVRQKRGNIPRVLAFRLSIFNSQWETDWVN